MAVVILLLHSSFEHEMIDGQSIFSGWDARCYHILDYVLVQNVCNVAVPLFFLISGFLFFKEGELTKSLYYKKLNKRVTSLLVPYLVWNVIICLFYLVVQNVAPAMNSGRNKLIADYSVGDYVMMFWSMSYIKEGGMNGPMDTPLWFIRDLMVMMILSPVTYKIIQKTKGLLPFLGLLLYISGVWQGIPGFSSSALTFFSLGAYFAICGVDFVRTSRKYVVYLASVYIAGLICVVLLKNGEMNISWIRPVLVVIGVFLSIGLGAYLVETKGASISPFLTGSTFFVFASHCELLKVFVRLASRVGIQNDLYYCVMYFACPFVTLLLLLIVYKGLKIYVPSVAKVLSGGR